MLLFSSNDAAEMTEITDFKTSLLFCHAVKQKLKMYLMLMQLLKFSELIWKFALSVTLKQNVGKYYNTYAIRCPLLCAF